MKITKWLGIAATALLVVTSARADDWWDTRVRYDSGHDQLFNANEFSLDLFGTYQAKEHHFLAWPNTDIKGHNGLWGGGVGGNYFFTRYLGVDAETAFLAETTHFVDHVGGNLIGRFPIDVAHLAPYVFGGGGRSFNPSWRAGGSYNWFWDVGAGLEFRLNPKLGIFADARYIWLENHNGDQAALRSGIRLVF